MGSPSSMIVLVPYITTTFNIATSPIFSNNKDGKSNRVPYAAAGNFPATFSTTNDRETLCTVGTACGSVIQAFGRNVTRPAEVYDHKFFAILRAQLLTAWTSSTQYQAQGCGFKELFWRSLIGNRTDDGKIPTDEYSAAFFHWLGHNESADPAQEYLELAWKILTNRQVIMTDKGLVGFAPATAKIGDIVAIILGCQTPMVFRPVPNSCDDGAGTLNVIGEAYMHGIMEGEVMDWVDAGDAEIEEFRIT